MSNKLSLQEQAKEVLRIAQEHGVEQNFFFITTFKRFQLQINIGVVLFIAWMGKRFL